VVPGPEFPWLLTRRIRDGTLERVVSAAVAGVADLSRVKTQWLWNCPSCGPSFWVSSCSLLGMAVLAGQAPAAEALAARGLGVEVPPADRGAVGACLRGESCSACGAEPEVHDTVGPLPQERKMLEAICSITRSQLPLLVF